MISQTTASAPAGVLYGLIADATQWPLFVQPCIHVEQLDFDGTHERLRLWATAGERITSWVTHRDLDVSRRRVTFRQELTSAPVESMSGVWTVQPLGDRCRVTLEHTFTVTDDAPAHVAWVEQVTRANSTAQLERLAWLAERWTALDDLVFSFENSVRFKGPAEVAFDFLYRAQDWPQRLPHVSGLHLNEPSPGVQTMTMDSLTTDGTTHRTESVRICFPSAGRLVYKQTRTQGLMSAHTGEWSVVPDAGGVTLSARHDVLLRQDDLARTLGPDATLDDAAQHVRDELGRASLLVLTHAERFAARAVRVL
ncbi:aromatase/cyclase [Streptomyces sp. NPDC088785]|uniref:aromatase/cyclase n=1 Tax=Streptomyces sp. NPDC088785 TaxID=3365897 RepID=UPI0038070852